MKLLSNYAKNDIEVGCYVRITKKAESHKDGWCNTWVSPTMDALVGRTAKVLEIQKGTCRQMLLHNNFWYPEFILETV